MNVTPDRAGFQPLSRRALICASPVLFVSPALGSSETLIQRLYREHSALEAEMNGPNTVRDEDLECGTDRLHDIEAEMAAAPITCLADLAIKCVALTALSGMGEGPHDDAVLAECMALANGEAAQ